MRDQKLHSRLVAFDYRLTQDSLGYQSISIYSIGFAAKDEARFFIIRPKNIGGIFGPLYHAFGIMRSALAVKLIAAAVMVPVNYLLIQVMGETGGA